MCVTNAWGRSTIKACRAGEQSHARLHTAASTETLSASFGQHPMQYAKQGVASASGVGCAASGATPRTSHARTGLHGLEHNGSVGCPRHQATCGVVWYPRIPAHVDSYVQRRGPKRRGIAHACSRLVKNRSCGVMLDNVLDTTSMQ